MHNISHTGSWDVILHRDSIHQTREYLEGIRVVLRDHLGTLNDVTSSEYREARLALMHLSRILLAFDNNAGDGFEFE